MKLDAKDTADRDRIKKRLHVWIKNGSLRIVEDKDGNRVKRLFVEVGEWAN